MAPSSTQLLEASGDEHVLLGDRTEQEWATMVAAMRPERFTAGQDVIRAGDRDRTSCLVVEGRLEVIAHDGTDAALRALRAPTVVGEIAFLGDRPRSVTLRAATDGELLRLGFADFEALAEREPALALAVLLDLGRIVAARLRMATDVIAEQRG